MADRKLWADENDDDGPRTRSGRSSGSKENSPNEDRRAPLVDKRNGFFKSIIRNQQDRDDYDRQQAEKKKERDEKYEAWLARQTENRTEPEKQSASSGVDADSWGHDGWDQIQKEAPKPPKSRPRGFGDHDDRYFASSRGRKGSPRERGSSRGSGGRSPGERSRLNAGPPPPRERKQVLEQSFYVPPRGKFSHDLELFDPTKLVEPAPVDGKEEKSDGARKPRAANQRAADSDARTDSKSRSASSPVSSGAEPRRRTPTHSDVKRYEPPRGKFSSRDAQPTAADDDDDEATPGGRVLLVMNIEVGPDQTAALHVHEGFDALQLARRFCRRHRISVEEYPQFIADAIVEQLALHSQPPPSPDPEPTDPPQDSPPRWR
eukprot:TRINITY_DN981_c0_g2_i1.p1 TRINITY_DN981_c0_g2~~TRINITY_DN981_c0_g2_i1.p1  ORF type:complete len:376 (-),score=72.91 TRINITY_DN981_c0_g2_i1:10-1137(-)